MLEKFILSAFDQISKRDFKFAFFQLCPAIDATAKKRYPNNKLVGERIELFLKDELNNIIKLATNIGPMARGSDHFQ